MTAASTWSLELLAYAMDPHAINPPPPPRPEKHPDQEIALCLYRRRTVKILHRYRALSIEIGRLHSSMGNLTFRARISSYPLTTFEDTAIFVFDVERCLRELDGFSQEIITRVVLQGYTPEATARILQCGWRTVYRKLPEALDEMTKNLLQRGILARSKISPKSCQGGKNGVFPTSD